MLFEVTDTVLPISVEEILGGACTIAGGPFGLGESVTVWH